MPYSQRDIHVYPTSQALLEAAAQHLLDHARQAIETRNSFTIALAGGSTPKGLYAMLAAPPFRSQLDWTKIRFFGEMNVTSHRIMRTVIIEWPMKRSSATCPFPWRTFIVCRANSLMPKPLPTSMKPCCASISKSQDRKIPRFDFILLGMGPDGHTASLFPGTKAVHETNRLVAAPWVERLQTSRITFTPVLLNHARQVTFLICGHAKADTLHAVLEGPFQPDTLPSQVIGPRAGTLTWFVDQEAAGALTFLQQ